MTFVAILGPGSICSRRFSVRSPAHANIGGIGLVVDAGDVFVLDVVVGGGPVYDWRVVVDMLRIVVGLWGTRAWALASG